MTAWANIPDAPGPIGSAGAALVPDGRIFLAGGYTAGATYTAAARAFDPATNAWADLFNLIDVVAAPACAADPSGAFYVCGGYAPGGQSARVQRRDPSTGSWAIVANMISPRGGAAGTSDISGRPHVFGGYNGSETATAERYDPSTNTWMSIAAMPSGGRANISAIRDPQGRIYVLGGNGTSGVRNERYDPSANQWVVLANMPTRRERPGLGVDALGRIYVFGGWSQGTPLATVDRYDPSSDSWSSILAMGTARAEVASAMDAAGRMYAIGGYNGNSYIATAERNTENLAPTAATPTTPATGSSVDRTSPITLAWVFSDPDAGDSQSKSDIRYKLTSASAWTTILGATKTATFYALPASQAADNYEWQVLTYDALGVASPWSSSSFFTAANPPGVPVVATPANGGTIATASYTVTWSSPQQDAYEVRRVADSAGSPNTGNAYFTTGAVEDATSRARTLAFDTNNRTEHVQVRVRYSGIWSQWATARVLVSYTPPSPPVITLVVREDIAGLQVNITNPAASGGRPAVTSNRIEVDDGLGDGFTLRQQNVEPSGSWLYGFPRINYDYEQHVRVTAVGENGTEASALAPVTP